MGLRDLGIIRKMSLFRFRVFKLTVYCSAFSEGKHYVADLELYQSVVAEKSTCVIKDTEAVILLVKEKKGTWCKLLKNKVK